MHELRSYLEMLLDHQCAGANGDCRECHRLERIYQFLQTELFSCVVYTESALESRQPPKSPSQVNRAAAGPRRPHAA